MKKLIIILLSVLTIFALSSCDVSELSAPAGDTTADETTEKSDETANAGEPHQNCDYCGQLEGNNRWFIAEVADDLMIHPVGSGCFEARSAMDAGIDLWYKEVDGDTNKKLKSGDIVKITYNGLIMESYPVQISADEVTVIDPEDITLPNKLTDYLVSKGSISVKSGDTTIYPLEGFVWSEESVYNEATGQMMTVNADGAGISFYLDAILNGKIDDEDMPTLYLDKSIYVNGSNTENISVSYISLDNSSKERIDSSLYKISTLPIGEYYVIFYIDANNCGYEYIFKLIIDHSIDDHILNDDSSTYLVLPSSKEKISVYGAAAGYLDRIDLELLATAESQLSSFEAVYLTLDDENYVCLGCESIVDIDPPNVIDGMTSGCGIDHKHVMEEYRISKEPCY